MPLKHPSTNTPFGRLNDRQQMRRADIEEFLNAWHQEASAKRANQEAWQEIPEDALTTINRLSASPADDITAQRDRLNAIRAQSAESRARGESARGIDPMSEREFAEHRARLHEEMSAPSKLIGAGLGLAGGLAAPLMVPAAPVLSGAALNALGGALPNWLMSTPEGVAQDAVAGGAMGLAASRIHPLAAIPAALASYAATSTPEAEAATFIGKNGPLRNVISSLIRRARSLDPENVAIEVAATGEPRRFYTSGKQGEVHVPDEAFVKGGWNLHTHPSDSSVIPSLQDWEKYREVPFQKQFGVVRPSILRGGESLIIEPTSSSFVHPTNNEFLDAQRRSGLSAATDQYDIGQWETLLGRSNDNDINLYLDSLNSIPKDIRKRFGMAGGGSVAGMAKRLAQRAMSEAGDVDAVMAPQGALSVIKNKGGNWLTGSVEDALKGLRSTHRGGEDPQVLIRQLQERIAENPNMSGDARRVFDDSISQLSRPAALNAFIDKQLTRYIKNEMATPEDPIRALAEAWPERKAKALTDQRARLEKALAERAAAANNPDLAAKLGVGLPIPEHYLTSSNARVNELQRQLSELELMEGLHVPQQSFGWSTPVMQRTRKDRIEGGFPEKETAATVLGRRWERNADMEVVRDGVNEYGQPVYKPYAIAYSPDLGFPHLTDELANALNPESGLPRHLLLDPKSMDRVSVPQAVERVAQINAWRAAQKVEADALRANNAATVPHKDYPLADYWHGGEYTPGSDITRPLYVAKNKTLAESYVDMAKDRTGKGSLVSLSHSAKSPAPENVVVEEARKLGIDVDSYTPASIFDSELHGEGVVSALVRRLKAKGYDSANLHDIGYGTQVDDTATVLFPGVKTNKGYDNPKGLKWVELRQPEVPDEEVLRLSGTNTGVSGGRAALADALKYEGDTMGHCVGGYCDDVASGRSRIYSLRDAKGQPHVTIEVAPGGGFAGKKTPEEYEAFLRNHPTPHSEEEIAQALRDLEQSGAWAQSIRQIKGKANRAPNEEYLPFVQDFVKSGKWSDVGDLQNSGLVLHPSGKYISDAEAVALAERHFGGKWGNGPDADENPFQYFNRVSRYDSDMLSDADKAFVADWKAGNFAEGGPVDRNNLSVKQLRDIIAQIRQDHTDAA